MCVTCERELDREGLSPVCGRVYIHIKDQSDSSCAKKFNTLLSVIHGKIMTSTHGSCRTYAGIRAGPHCSLDPSNNSIKRAYYGSLELLTQSYMLSERRKGLVKS